MNQNSKQIKDHNILNLIVFGYNKIIPIHKFMLIEVPNNINTLVS